jgi:hypothetical protein
VKEIKEWVQTVLEGNDLVVVVSLAFIIIFSFLFYN